MKTPFKVPNITSVLQIDRLEIGDNGFNNDQQRNNVMIRNISIPKNEKKLLQNSTEKFNHGSVIPKYATKLLAIKNNKIETMSLIHIPINNLPENLIFAFVFQIPKIIKKFEISESGITTAKLYVMGRHTEVKLTTRLFVEFPEKPLLNIIKG